MSDYAEGRLANERLNKARQVRASHVRVRRQALNLGLQKFFSNLENDAATQRADKIARTLRHEVEAAADMDIDEAAARLAGAEAQARQAVRDLDAALEVRRPRGVALTKDLAREFAAYERVRAEIRASVLNPLDEEIEAVVRMAGNARHTAVARRVRFDEAVSGEAARSSQQLDRSRNELRRSLSELQQRADGLVSLARIALSEATQQALSTAARTDTTALSDAEFIVVRTRLENAIAGVSSNYVTALDSISSQIQDLVWPSEDDGPIVTAADQVEELESRLEAFVARAEYDVELTQIGMAVEIVNHEFQTSIKNIRRNLRRLKGWSDNNPELVGVYRDLRSSFEHLDGYLKLFTPLHRRLYRSAVDIRGDEIARYIHDLFSARLADAEIIFKVTEEFASGVVRAYPSTIYPVFVNLVDNAVHWLSDYRGERIIEFDRDGEDLIVTDTGPGISARDMDAVFELGFSRRPAGTGYGLTIARQVLDAEGFALTLDSPAPDRGARFHIRPKADQEREP